MVNYNFNKYRFDNKICSTVTRIWYVYQNRINNNKHTTTTTKNCFRMQPRYLRHSYTILLFIIYNWYAMYRTPTLPKPIRRTLEPESNRHTHTCTPLHAQITVSRKPAMGTIVGSIFDIFYYFYLNKFVKRIDNVRSRIVLAAHHEVYDHRVRM